jgi:ribosome-associated toxin RatA of RatAB toxin-antitoxin module
LKAVSEHIVEVKPGPLPEDLFVHTEAFRYHARMQMKLKVVTEPARRIEFTVVSGHFTGMTGDFSFEDYKGKTLMGFHAEYKYTVLPMPAFFVEFALEVVLQRVATLMREFLEKK